MVVEHVLGCCARYKPRFANIRTSGGIFTCFFARQQHQLGLLGEMTEASARLMRGTSPIQRRTLLEMTVCVKGDRKKILAKDRILNFLFITKTTKRFLVAPKHPQAWFASRWERLELSSGRKKIYEHPLLSSPSVIFGQKKFHLGRKKFGQR